MDGILFFAGSFFIEGGLALLLMMIITEPARAGGVGPGRTTELPTESRKAA